MRNLNEDAPPKRAFLKYLGGKWAIAPWVIAHLPPHRVYVEPFGGGAGVLLRKPRSRIEVYNDLDEEIVGMFRVVQHPQHCQQLMRVLNRTPYSRREFELAFTHSDDPIVRAQRAIVRAYQGFHHGSMFDPKKRTFANAKHRGKPSSPASSWANYPRSLVSISRRLHGVIIECQPAAKVISAQDEPDTLFFVDPPYLPSTRTAVGYRHEMSEADHRALLDQLLNVRGMVVIAGYPSELYDSTLRGWQRVERPHHAAGSKRLRTEVLWISPNATDAAQYPLAA